jgi:acyl-CoA reductase LuxC
VDSLCAEHHLLQDDGGVTRVPFLIKGRLVVPPEIGREAILAAFEGAEAGDAYIKRPDCQLIRQPVIDRATMRATSEYAYQVLPPIQPLELIDTDFDGLVSGPYALTVEAVLDYLETIATALQDNPATLDRARELSRRTSLHPDVYLDGAFATLQFGLDPESARAMVDNELSMWSLPGSRFLDGWVEVPAEVIPGLAPLLAQGLPDGGPAALSAATPPAIRALPTRQLHITAGNAPAIPLVSALRLVLTKSAGVIKCPFEVTLPGALLVLAAAAAAPDHPLTRHLSVVYWQGGDESVEAALFAPGAFDRIVVWGAPDAVQAVRSRAAFTKTLTFNPRYGLSLIGREAFVSAESLRQAAAAAGTDVMIYDQKACTASQVQYVEGTPEQVQAYADCLAEVLGRWDDMAQPYVPPAARGQLKRMQRGKYANASWRTNLGPDERYSSGVVVMANEFDIMDHPMCRLVVVRPVDNLRQALPYFHAGVSTVGVYPEARRLELRDAIAARGVSNVLPLGQCERIFAGAPQDGMIVLSELVDWKNA